MFVLPSLFHTDYLPVLIYYKGQYLISFFLAGFQEGKWGSLGAIGLKLSFTKCLLRDINLSQVEFSFLLLKLSLYGPGAMQIVGVFMGGVTVKFWNCNYVSNHRKKACSGFCNHILFLIAVNWEMDDWIKVSE